MKNFKEILEEQFQHALQIAYPEIIAIVDIAQATNEKFGHYQFNSAMKLAKLIGKSPRSIAEKIIQNLDKNYKNSPFIQHLEIAGPGFINITLEKEAIASKIENILHSDHLGIEPLKIQQKVIVDFSSPNVAKEMHVGHLRSTIIGDCLARLFEFLGYDVLRLNHIGDWGTAFGMLIAYIKQYHPEVIENNYSPSLPELMEWYKTAKKLFDTDPEFKKCSQLHVVSLQKGDFNDLKLWNLICAISEKAYQEIYDLLNVKIMIRGESYYNPMLENLVKDLENKGLIQISDGAKCIFLEGFQNREGELLPLMIQKSDGGYNYDTTDMAAIRHRIEEEKGDRLIYVTDAGQHTHFLMIFKAAQMARYLDPQKTQTDHVPFGLVLGLDGKKFKTRSGETEKLIDLLNNAILEAEKILKERSPDMPEIEQKELAKALGIGAVKYADLSCHRMSDYTFSYERMLRFEGNTAAFLMYAYVRTVSIKRKIGLDISQLIKNNSLKIEHPSEMALALQIAQFDEVLKQVSIELLPNRLTDYLFTLAEKFNAFFRDCRVEGSPEQNSRLLLCEAVSRTIRKGLEIIGITPIEKM